MSGSYVGGRRCYDCRRMYLSFDVYDGHLMGCEAAHWLGQDVCDPADLRTALTLAERCDDYEKREEEKT